MITRWEREKEKKQKKDSTRKERKGKETSIASSMLEASSNGNGMMKGFDEFWQAYPKKKAKGEAERAWKTYHPPLNLILPAIAFARQSKDWTKEGGQYIPNPATWIRSKGWEDEHGNTKQEAPKGTDVW